MNDMKFTTAGDYMKDIDMINEELNDEVTVEKTAAERLRKSEVARAKRKAVKEKKELEKQQKIIEELSRKNPKSVIVEEDDGYHD